MPSFISIHNRTRPNPKPATVKYCTSFLCRLRGLTFRSNLGKDEGLLLVQSKRDSRVDSSIHMLFVPFELSVIWIDSHMKVTDKVLAKPWRLAYFPSAPARFVLEIHPDRWDEYQVGDLLEFKDA